MNAHHARRLARTIGLIAIVSMPIPSALAATPPPPKVKALLEANGCLACHATDKKIVGPAYQDVAAKYKADAEAVAKVAASIKAGGAGKWGEMAMPPFASLKDDQAKALATFVLQQ